MIVMTENELRQVATPFDFKDQEVDLIEFRKELIEAMWLNNGLGVSAVQIGKNLRILAMRGKTKEESIVMVNPIVEEYSTDFNTMEEGCLSIPDVFARVVRPSEVSVTWTNELNEEEKERLDGLTARVFQHELDHLEGILFIDRIKPFARKRAFDKAKKIQKMRGRGKEKYKARFAL